MSQRILFLHGLASSGRFKMADQLRILLKPCEVYAPDIPPEPWEALPMLQEVCEGLRPDIVVGHSLGGFWAQKLRGWRKALVNPTFLAAGIFRSKMGRMYYLSPRADGAKYFEITPKMCDAYAELEAAQFDGLDQAEKDLTIGFFADGDDVVKHRDKFEQHYGKPGIVYPGGHIPVYPEMKQYIVPEIKKLLV